MKSSVCYKYVRVAFLPIVNTSTQPEVLRQIGIRFIICVVAMWLQALDKTLSMRRDKLSAWHFPNYLHRYGATLHDEVTMHNMTYNFATSIPLSFPKLHLNGWSECATNHSIFFPYTRSKYPGWAVLWSVLSSALSVVMTHGVVIETSCLRDSFVSLTYLFSR